MLNQPSFSSSLTLQGIAAIFVFVAIAFAPPANGAMLIIPLLPTARPAVEVTTAGGLIVAAGAIPGSVIVVGDRSRILPAVLAGGSIAVSTSRHGCRERSLAS